MTSQTPTPLARRRRHSARLALYLSLATVGLLLAATYFWMQPRPDFGLSTAWAKTDWESQPGVAMLQEYVRINTSEAPHGDPMAGSLWVAERLREMGLDPVVERVGSEANVWAVLEGRRKEAVVLHHHVDVDPIPRPELWQVDPFSGEVDGPWIYGRGTFDMKSVAVAQLLALQDLVDSGRVPERSVIVLATTGEEVGSQLGTKWFLRRHPELVERFDVVLTEGGSVEGRAMDDLTYWGTEFVQKRIVDVVLCGSRELLEESLENLRQVGLLESAPRLVPEVERFMRDYAPTRLSAELRRQFGQPGDLIRSPELRSLTDYQRSFFLDQVFTRMDGEGGTSQLTLRLVLLPGTDPDEAVDRLVPPWVRHGLQMRVLDEGAASRGTTLDHWAFQEIHEVMAERRPEVPHGPLVLTLTVTDARFFRAAGIPAFGYSPFGVLTGDVLLMRRHGTVNERMTLPGFVDGLELYSAVLNRLAG